jgi:hypothetical protein
LNLFKGFLERGVLFFVRALVRTLTSSTSSMLSEHFLHGSFFGVYCFSLEVDLLFLFLFLFLVIKATLVFSGFLLIWLVFIIVISEP